MKRVIEPEWLDELPANDPAAERSRRDLQRINCIMGHVGIMCRLLQTRSDNSPPKRIVELGAGDGKFMLEIAKRLAPRWPALEVMLLDAKDAVADSTVRALKTLGWKTEIVAADVFDFLKKPADEPADIMLANLFLHQFSPEPLRQMLHLASERSRLFAACEPRRGPLQFAISKLVGFIGCNAVTRNDAPLSVRAGFVGDEISALWPSQQQWQLRENRAGVFTHAFAAERNAA